MAESVAREQLRAFVERIERMEEEKKAISDDIKEIYAEAKGSGFDTKVIRHIIRLRRMNAPQRQQHLAVLDVYLVALGMLPGTVETDDEGEAEVAAADAAAEKKKRGRKPKPEAADLGFDLGEGV